MVTLDGDILVLDRSQNGDDILPLYHPGKAGKGSGWYIDIGIENQEVMHRLIDLEILDEPIAIRYITRDGKRVEAQAQIEELVSGPEGDMCRLHGKGKVPDLFLADEPKQI